MCYSELFTERRQFNDILLGGRALRGGDFDGGAFDGVAFDGGAFNGGAFDGGAFDGGAFDGRASRAIALRGAGRDSIGFVARNPCSSGIGGREGQMEGESNNSTKM